MNIQNIITSRPYKITEFLILCIGIPTLLIVNLWVPFMFAFLWGAALYCFVIYRLTSKESLRTLWNWGAVTWPHMKPLLVRFVFAIIGMALFLLWYDPERFLHVPREMPQILPFLLVVYPVLSALPQEFIFCSFFFARYAYLFGRGKGMVVASTLTFAYAHFMYINPVAPLLSLFGGYIFARTYMEHKSLALVTIEHGLYGNALFVLGLGWYFYSGSVVVQ